MSAVARSGRTGRAQARRPRLIDLRGDRLGLPTAPHVREAARQALADGETHYPTRPRLNARPPGIAHSVARCNALRRGKGCEGWWSPSLVRRGRLRLTCRLAWATLV